MRTAISVRQYGFIIAAVVPVIVCFLVLTVPALIFRTPEHQAYFYFGRILSDDPVCLFPMAIAAVCTFVALSMPVAHSRPLFQRIR